MCVSSLTFEHIISSLTLQHSPQVSHSRNVKFVFFLVFTHPTTIIDILVRSVVSRRTIGGTLPLAPQNIILEPLTYTLKLSVLPLYIVWLIRVCEVEDISVFLMNAHLRKTDAQQFKRTNKMLCTSFRCTWFYFFSSPLPS